MSIGISPFQTTLLVVSTSWACLVDIQKQPTIKIKRQTQSPSCIVQFLQSRLELFQYLENSIL